MATLGFLDTQAAQQKGFNAVRILRTIRIARIFRGVRITRLFRYFSVACLRDFSDEGTGPEKSKQKWATRGCFENNVDYAVLIWQRDILKLHCIIDVMGYDMLKALTLNQWDDTDLSHQNGHQKIGPSPLGILFLWFVARGAKLFAKKYAPWP